MYLNNIPTDGIMLYLLQLLYYSVSETVVARVYNYILTLGGRAVLKVILILDPATLPILTFDIVKMNHTF